MTLDLDLRAATRSLGRSPGYVIAVVLSLGLGIGAAAAAFGVIDAVRLRALPFRDADRLVLVSEVPTASPEACRLSCDVSYETYADLLRLHPPTSVDAIAAYTAGGKALGMGEGEEPILVMGGVISPNLFGLLGVSPIRGRAFSEDDDRLGVPLVTVLSHELWVNRFGSDPEIVGKTIKLSDSHYTVIGVMPQGFNHEVGSQFWLPVVPTLDPSTRPSIRSVTVIGRLAPGQTLARLQGELANLDPAALVRPGPGGKPAQMRLEASPLRARYAGSTQSHDLIFGAIVGCVLLIACANVANLALVRTLHQLREYALRSALGARATRLLRALLAQNLVLVLIAAGLGLLFAAWFLGILRSLEALQSLRPSGMEYRMDARVVGFGLLLAIGVASLLGVISARTAARANVYRLLRDGGPTSGGGRMGSRLQQAFVVIQIGCAVALLTGGGLLAKTSMRLARLNPGFDATVLRGSPSYPHPWRVKEKYLPVTRGIAAALTELPGAASAAIRAGNPAGPLTLEGNAEPLPAALAPRTALSVSPGYFATLGIPMARGREFTEWDKEEAPGVAIVNEWAARHWWPGQDALGRTIRVDTSAAGSTTLTVVGVARDNKASQGNLLLAEDGPELYRPYEQAPSAFPQFFVRARGEPGRLLRPMRGVLVRMVPDRPLFASLLSEDVNTQLAGVRLNAVQIVAFALVGLLLALLGVHGVLSYMVGRRSQEIGVRSALGATRGGIQRMILADAARLAALGLLLGLPAAALGTRLIRRMLYGTSPTDLPVYVAVGIGVALVAVAAAYLPARRAARVDPATALRAS